MKAKKSLGQNFLTDATILSRIIEFARAQPSDTILEIGPGTGVLTTALAAQTKQVIAIEIDTDLIPNLLKKFQQTPNVDIVNQDILQTNLETLFQERGIEKSIPYRVIANIPYYITAPIIQHLLKAQPQPKDIVLMVQKEVAKRITAKPGEMSVLALSIQARASVEYGFTVPKTAFDPIPKVESAIIRITPQATQAPSESFFRLIKIGFSSKRKTLANNLSAGLLIPKEDIAPILQSIGLETTIRPQMLSLTDWYQLDGVLKAKYATKQP